MVQKEPKEAQSRFFLAKEDRKLLYRCFGYLRPHKWLFAGVFILVLITVGVQLYPPMLYGKVIDYIMKKDLHTIWITLVKILVFTFLSSTLGLLQSYMVDVLNNRIVMDIKQDIYEHIVDLPMKILDTMGMGEVIARIDSDVAAITNVITFRVVGLVVDIVRIFGIGFLIFRINWVLSCIVLLMFPLTYVVMNMFTRVIRKKNRTLRTMNDVYLSFISETFSGLREIRALNIQRLIKGRFRDMLQQIFKFRIKTDVFGFLNGFLVQGIGSINRLAIIGIGSFQIIQGHFTIGGYVSFTTYSEQFNMALGKIAYLNMGLQQVLVSLERIFSVKDHLTTLSERTGDRVLKEACGTLKMEKVCFSYVPGQEVLHDVTFTIPAGQITALVGASGSGKSTLFNLLLRFYRPDSGGIRLGDSLVDELATDFYRQQVAVVPQEPFLFNLSIKENLLLAKQDATMDEMIEAAKKAYIHHFIMSLPEGYDTVVGERAARLSGGQKQRLAIARVILKGAKILLFDEATSALDGESEEYITRTLHSLLPEHTIVVIAHRLSTVLHADQIIVLDHGEVVGEGQHMDLIRSNPTYQRLYQSQWNRLNEVILSQVEEQVL